MNTKYYLPINSICLAHYFGSACIMPSKYFTNKPKDIQDEFQNYLLLTSELGAKDIDCCIEIILLETELSDLIKVNDKFFLYSKPLPISRVKMIFFINENQKEQTITNIELSTAFIPKQIIKVVERFSDVTIDKLKFSSYPFAHDWTEQLDRYNRFLGAFALMRLSGEDYMNYSEHYFSTLSFFNTVIKEELVIAGKNVDQRFWDAFIGNGSFKNLYPILNKSISDNDLYEIAKSEDQIIEKNPITKIVDLTKINKTATYTAAVLNTYGVGNEARKKKVDGLILSNFKSEINPDKSEGVALCYGLNRGYSIFSNKYKLGEKEKIVKFQLNSQTDYYTIESLYQYIFNGIISKGFPYLDNWCPQKEMIRRKNTDYIVLDTLVIGKKRPRVSSPEYLENILQIFFQKKQENLFKDFINSLRTIIYNDVITEQNEDLEYDKERLVQLMNAQSIKIKEQENIIELLKQGDKTSKRFINNTKTKESIHSVQSLVDKKLIIKEYLSYDEKKTEDLRKEAKQKGINIPPKTSKGDLILLLMTSPRNVYFDSDNQLNK